MRDSELRENGEREGGSELGESVGREAEEDVVVGLRWRDSRPSEV